MPEFYMKFAEKYFSRILGKGMHVPTPSLCPPSPAPTNDKPVDLKHWLTTWAIYENAKRKDSSSMEAQMSAKTQKTKHYKSANDVTIPQRKYSQT